MIRETSQFFLLRGLLRAFDSGAMGRGKAAEMRLYNHLVLHEMRAMQVVNRQGKTINRATDGAWNERARRARGAE